MTTMTTMTKENDKTEDRGMTAMTMTKETLLTLLPPVTAPFSHAGKCSSVAISCLLLIIFVSIWLLWSQSLLICCTVTCGASTITTCWCWFLLILLYHPSHGSLYCFPCLPAGCVAPHGWLLHFNIFIICCYCCSTVLCWCWWCCHLHQCLLPLIYFVLCCWFHHFCCCLLIVGFWKYLLMCCCGQCYCFLHEAAVTYFLFLAFSLLLSLWNCHYSWCCHHLYFCLHWLICLMLFIVCIWLLSQPITNI